MRRAGDLIPWKVTDISFRPYKGMWSFNPSIHYDGFVWRGVLRCSDYAMPDGVMIRGRRAVRGEALTKSAMVIFDPASWKPVEIYKMRERDKLPRVPSTSVGYEDIRIFRTAKGGFQGIAASLHLQRDPRDVSPYLRDVPQRHLVEQVLLSFDAEYNVVEALPIRGGWSAKPQKNWAPFDGCEEPRFLYSIGEGVLFDERGPVNPEEAPARPSTSIRAAVFGPSERALRRARERASENVIAREGVGHRQKKSDRWRFDADPLRAHLTCEDLRGGTPLVRVDAGAWLGIGHAMQLVEGLKYYWHVWYLVDARGKLMAASPPMKLAPNGIEFAAGLAIVGERVVVSFGVDDMECKIGETKLAAVLEVLQKSGGAR